MLVKDCRTTVERDVLNTYRRIVRRKGAHWFGAVSMAIREEMAGGAVLDPNFVERFSRYTRTLDDRGQVVLTAWGRAVLRAIDAGDDMPVLVRHAHDGRTTACDLPVTEIAHPPVAAECATADCIACHAVNGFPGETAVA